jgi:NarL family two-component system response regulator LiaR
MPKTSQPIRVMLVDDHAMVRRGLAFFLDSFEDVILVGEADGGEAAIELCPKVRPDVVLMDMKMPEMDGVTATRLIHKQFPTIGIIALTSFKESNLIEDVLRAGALGYLLKDVSAEELIKAIRSAYNGHSSLSPEAAEALIQASRKPAQPGGNLTKRELEVLRLMTAGLNNTQIAAKLVVSPLTIKAHVSNILSKLNVTSRSEAVALALRIGLVT